MYKLYTENNRIIPYRETTDNFILPIGFACQNPQKKMYIGRYIINKKLGCKFVC